jgi:Anti-sigma-D factor RsdA to sigma factor binding region
MPAQPPSGPLVPSSDGTQDPPDATIVGMFAGGSGEGRGRHARHDDADSTLDLSALHADDELLTALCSHDNSLADADSEPELKSLLLSWRLDVDAEPIAELVDTDTAMRTIERARNQRRKPRYLVPLASAAAVLVIVFAGMGLAARDAHPGDTLWGLSQVLYADHARSVEAAAVVRTELTHASQALEQGHLIEAANALAVAKASLPAVDNADGKATLQEQQQNLLNQLAATTSATAPAPTDIPSTAPVTAPLTTTTPLPMPTTVVTTTPPPPLPSTVPPTPTTDPTLDSTTPAPQSDPFTPQQQDATTPDTNGAASGNSSTGGDTSEPTPTG